MPGDIGMSSRNNLLIPALPATGGRGTVMEVSAKEVGFDYLDLQVQRLLAGDTCKASTNLNELGIVGLGGRFDLESSKGSWRNVGVRANVFSGMPSTVYLPIETDL